MSLVFDTAKLIGYQYADFYWLNCKCRYRILYGARNTGKSYSCGYEIIDKILSDPMRNVVCFRNSYTDIKDTIFSNIKSKLMKTGLFILFKIKHAPMEIIYRQTGQSIRFKGCDEATNVASIEPEVGINTDYYFEEAFEMNDYDTFRIFDGSLRCSEEDRKKLLCPQQITLMLNPWQKEGCWIYDHFIARFQPDDETTMEVLEKCGKRIWRDDSLVIDYGIGLFLMQSTYKVNDFRDKEIYDKTAREMKNRSIEIYKVEYLGMWGASGDRVYSEYSDRLLIPHELAMKLNYKYFYLGIDTSYSNGEGRPLSGMQLEKVRVRSAYSIQLAGLVSDTQTNTTLREDERSKVPSGSIIALNEFYYSAELGQNKMTPTQLQEATLNKVLEWINIYAKNTSLMKSNIFIFVDSADSATLTTLQEMAKRKYMTNVYFRESTKYPINLRIRFTRLLMAWGQCLFTENVPNLTREIRNCHASKGMIRDNINDHAINAFEYATAPMYSQIKQWQGFKC